MAQAVTDAPVRPPKRPGGNPLLRASLVLLAVVVGGSLIVPVGTVIAAGANINGRSSLRYENTLAKMKIAEVSRPYGLPPDSSIGAIQAGEMFRDLHPSEKDRGFPLRAHVDTQPPFWRTHTMAPDLFQRLRSVYDKSVPPTQGLLQAATKGFSADERDYLRGIATDPIWTQVEMVARAPRVDIVGGWLVVPFPDSASIRDMPIMRFGATKEIAYAAVARAAYHLEAGRRDSAEHALRTIVSFGFMMADNGTSLIDQLIGLVVVGIGRSGLMDLYALTSNPRGAALKASHDSVVAHYAAEGKARDTTPVPRTRERLAAMIADPTLPRGLRFELLTSMAIQPCTNVRELLFGPGQDVALAFAGAREKLARSRAEVAQIDLASRMLDRPIHVEGSGDSAVLPAIAVDAASVAATIFRNPRLASCTSLLLQHV